MSCKDDDLQAPWVGKSREEYYGYDDEEDLYATDDEYDEDFDYEISRYIR